LGKEKIPERGKSPCRRVGWGKGTNPPGPQKKRNAPDTPIFFADKRHLARKKAWIFCERKGKATCVHKPQKESFFPDSKEKEWGGRVDPPEENIL